MVNSEGLSNKGKKGGKGVVGSPVDDRPKVVCDCVRTGGEGLGRGLEGWRRECLKRRVGILFGMPSRHVLTIYSDERWDEGLDEGLDEGFG